MAKEILVSGISDILRSLSMSSEQATKNLDSLGEIKKGLMSDLLTGRVRVNVDAKSSGKIGEAA